MDMKHQLFRSNVSFVSEMCEPRFGNNVAPVSRPALVKSDELTIPKVYRSVPGNQGDTNMDPPMPYVGAINNIIRIHFPEKPINKLVCNKENQLADDLKCSQNDNRSSSRVDEQETTMNRMQRKSCSELEQSFSSNISDDESPLIIDLDDYESNDDDTNSSTSVKPDQVVDSSSDEASRDTERCYVNNNQDTGNKIDVAQIKARTEPLNKSRYPKPVQVSAKNLPRSKKMLLWGQKMIAKMPHIVHQGNAFAVWTDIKEILFPLCSHAICNIVLNALKLKLHYPRLSLHMHPCTQMEHVSFARCLRVVYPGEMLVNLKKVNNILPELWHIVARNHLNCKHNEVSVYCQYVVNAKTMYWNMIATEKSQAVMSVPHENEKEANHEIARVLKMTSYVPHAGKLYRVPVNNDKLSPKKDRIMTNTSGLSLSYLPKFIREHLIQDTFICGVEDESHAREMLKVKMPAVLIRDSKHIETSEFIQLFSSVQQNLISNKFSDLEYQAHGDKLKFFNRKKHKFQGVEGFRPDPCMISNEVNVQLSFPILRISGTNNDAFIPMPELARFFPQMHGYLFQMCIKYIIGRRPSDICEYVLDGYIKCCSAEDGKAFTKWLLTARHVGGQWSHITSTCLLMRWSKFVQDLQTISAGQQQVRDCERQQTDSESLDASQKQSKHQSDIIQQKHRPMNNVVRSTLLLATDVNEARGNRSTLNPVLTENKYVYHPSNKLIGLINSMDNNETYSSASNIPNDSAINYRVGIQNEKTSHVFSKSSPLATVNDYSSSSFSKKDVLSSNGDNLSSKNLSLKPSFPEIGSDTFISNREQTTIKGVYVIGQINKAEFKQRVGQKILTKEHCVNAISKDSPNMQKSNPEVGKKVITSMLIGGDINEQEHRMKLRSNVALIDTDHRYGNVDRLKNNANIKELPQSVNGKETNKKMRKRRKLNRKGSRKNSFDNNNATCTIEKATDKCAVLIGIPDISTKTCSSKQVDSSKNPPQQLNNNTGVNNSESYSSNMITGVSETRKKSKGIRKNRQLPNLYDDGENSDEVLNVQCESTEERKKEWGEKARQDETNKKDGGTASSDDHSEESSSLGSDECSNNSLDSGQTSSVEQELHSSKEETDVCTPLPSSEITAIYNALCRNSQKISSAQKEEKKSKKKQKKRRESSLIVSKRIDDAKVYPCYGKFVKALPIKKNLLIREMLVNDVEKLKELACLVCTCVNVVTGTDGEQVKKYFQTKHKKNSNHCLVHSNKLDTLAMFEKTKENWSPNVIVKSASNKFRGKYLKFHNPSPLKRSKKLSCHKKVSPPKKHFLNKYCREMMLGETDIQIETGSEKNTEQKVVYAHPKKYFLKRFDQEDDTSVDGDSHFEHYKPPYDYNVLIKRYIRIGRLAPSVEGDVVAQDQLNSINLPSKSKIAVSNWHVDKSKSANSMRVTSKKSVSKCRQKKTIIKTQESREDRQLRNLIKSQMEILKVIQNRAAKQKEGGVLVKRNEKNTICTNQKEQRTKTTAVGRKRCKRSTRDFIRDFEGRIC